MFISQVCLINKVYFPTHAVFSIMSIFFHKYFCLVLVTDIQ